MSMDIVDYDEDRVDTPGGLDIEDEEESRKILAVKLL